jgi:phospholipid/cholesterol/gamma-HCH transport system substrate-binding protein
MKPKAALWRIGISLVFAGFAFILIVNVITQPVTADVRSYTAQFIDASGLHPGADVRVRGVSVGKVATIELQRLGGQSVAAIAFTLDKRYGVVSGTRLAIKYQSLTGVRYVDVVNPSAAYSTADLVTHVPTNMTQPSFDITALFNGLQPVIATLSPEEVNTFAANAETYMSGDGGGLAPMLDSIRKLTEFVSDRQQVIATLMRNLSEVADTMGGQSKGLIKILEWLNMPIDATLTVLDEFRKLALFGPDFTAETGRLLHNIGFEWGADMDGGLDRAFTNVDNFMETIKLVPVMWDNIPPPSQDGGAVPCSRGRAQLPATMDVLLNGQRVVLCNR